MFSMSTVLAGFDCLPRCICKFNDDYLLANCTDVSINQVPTSENQFTYKVSFFFYSYTYKTIYIKQIDTTIFLYYSPYLVICWFLKSTLKNEPIFFLAIMKLKHSLQNIYFQSCLQLSLNLKYVGTIAPYIKKLKFKHDLNISLVSAPLCCGYHVYVQPWTF